LFVCLFVSQLVGR